MTEEISVAKGYEAAIGAALGDDLDASTNPASPAHWAATDASDDPALPPGVEALAKRVTAPAPLARRLNQIGVVLRAEGGALRNLLKPGQRLVSKEGDLWRWDGFTQAAEAPTPAARRLAEKNRLGDLAIEAEAARAAASALKIDAERAQTALTAAAAAERDARQAHKDALRKVEAARDEKTAGEKRQTEMAARLSALDEAMIRIEATRAEACQKRAQAEDALAQLELPGNLTAQLDKARAAAAQDRATVAEARAGLQSYLRDAETREKRLQGIKEERLSWVTRGDRARGQIGELEARHAEATQELQKLLEAPDTFLVTRQTLMRQIEEAEDARKKSADKRVAAETRLAEADRAARGALDAMSVAREEKARSEARVEAARTRRDEVAHMISADIGCTEAELFGLAQAAPGDDLPPAEVVEKKLDGLKGDRERLGGVNLRADEELNEILASKTNLSTEHADLTEAIRRLRQAVHSLNKEGRERLLAAFDAVHAHFKELFTTLFGGGSAELQLIESEDPLEAGLEIVVRPPGQKAAGHDAFVRRRAGACRHVVDFRDFSDKSIAGLRSRRSGCAARRRQCRALLRSSRNHARQNRDAVYYGDPQSDHHGADEPAVWRHHGRARRQSAGQRRS